ncbi:hypothetical protein V5O48_005351 [Marasmius crinis-equi]|uniref:F-box domain-containing protein n=1 Tax=Marasmius crinis-equi TaxID=585013 RepID=A0ABR3FMJ5_9AGAR
METSPADSAPIHRLPYDSLALVFHFYAYTYELDPVQIWHDDLEDGEHEYEMAHIHHRPPWTLGKVCRAWRSVALSLPKFWTNFDLKTSCPGGHQVYLGVTEMLVVQLERCKGQPIYLRFQDLQYELDYSIGQKIVRSILTPRTRVASLSLSSNSDSHAICHLNDLPARTFPDIEEINLDIGDERVLQIGYSLKPLDASLIFPKLRSLNIWGRNDTPVQGLQIPWSQIIRFTSRDSKGSYASNYSHYLNLPRLENLQMCWLDCVIIDSEYSVKHTLDQPLVLPCLHTLILSSRAPIVYDGNATPGIAQMLESLSLPALRSLKFWDSFRTTSQSLIRFIHRSGCSLRELTIYDILSHDYEEVLHMLRSGSLETLEFLSVGWRSNPPGIDPTEIFKVLTRNPNSAGDHFPQLRSFETTCWEHHEQVGEDMDHRITADKEVEDRRARVKEALRDPCTGGLVLEWKAKGFRGL